MKKKLTLLIILLPCFVMAQQKQDTVPQSHKKKVKIHYLSNPNDELPPIPDETNPDFSTQSLFKALFVGGVNLAQVDGDAESGYKKIGAVAGVGTVVKFSKRFSLSAELLYSMKGAKPHFSTYESGKKDQYDITMDYIDLPITFSIHDKRVLMFGAGLQVSALLRYSQTDSAGNNVTAHPNPDQQPRKVDLMGQVCATFFIKERIGLGVRFAYSLLKIRDAVQGVNLKGEYNNVVSLRLSYLLDPKNPSWKKK